VNVARARSNGRVFHAELDGSDLHVLEGDVFMSPTRTGETVPLSDATLLSPVDPGTIYVMLGGFLPADGSPLPPGTLPRLAMKRVSQVSGDGADVIVPRFVTKQLWAEVELAIVIGKDVHDVSLDEARDAIWGYTCFNDVSAAEFIYDVDTFTPLQRPDYFRCKSIETFAVMGPVVRTDLTEADIQAGLELTTYVNGERKAGGNTSKLKFPMGDVVHYIAEQTALRPGDVIALGTPQPADAGPGDEVVVEAEGIGALRNRVVAAA
jgi:2-keto-4-pentenoate hydratase/2-oxohepta-3-ene-1,7-dioic acid hydratase in catechol pathway